MSRPGTIKLEALAALAALVSGGVSCTQSYYWGSYEDSVRGMCVKDKGYDSGRELERLTREIDWAEAGRWKLVPPGKYMHVGYLHYLAGDAEAARRYFLKEKEWFPESARFVDGMLERMGKLATPTPAVASSPLAGRYPQERPSGQECGTRSILVLPPLNETSEISAPYELYATITRPLAERGYYVYPVAIVDHFMKANGLPTAGEMHAVSLGKIHEIIGADAVLYPTVATWHRPNIVLGAVALLVGVFPPSTVEVGYRLVDVKTGDVIWECAQSARDTKSLPNLGNQCNQEALGQRLPLGPRHPAYRGPLAPLMDTTAQ